MGLYVAAAGLLAWRAVWGRHEHWAWLLVSGGMLAWAGGYAYFFAFLSGSSNPPVPSPSDVLWVSYDVLSFTGLLLLLRARMVRSSRSVLWLHASNTLTALLAGSALIAATVFDPLRERVNASTESVATALTYPLADMAVLLLLFVVLAVSHWRPGGLWAVVGGAWLLHAVANLFYVDLAATDSYVGGGLLDVTWPLAMLAIAFAAWRWHDTQTKLPVPAVATVAPPVLLGVIAVGVLAYGNLEHVPKLATWLAVLSIFGAVLSLSLVEYSTRQLRSQVRRDALTGLLNHREFHESVAALIDRGLPFAVALLDLDRFKEVNDLYGHAEGDRVLCSVAAALEESCRAEDVTCRIGGDEFAIVLSDSGLAEAKHVVDRLTAMIERIEPAVSASAGFAQWPDDGPDKTALLLRADVALYAAKNGHDRLEPAPGKDAADETPSASLAPSAERIAAVTAAGPSPVLARVDRYPAWAVLTACGALAALIFAAKLAIPNPVSAVLLLLSVPIVLLALRFGSLGGALGALGGMLLLGVSDILDARTPGVVGYLTRTVSFFTLALIAGRFSELGRRAQTMLERRAVQGWAEVTAAKAALSREASQRSLADRDLSLERDTVAIERDFLAAVLESLDEGIVACDAKGDLSFFNQATRRLHGLQETSIPPTEWAEHYDLYGPDGTTRMLPEEIPLYRAFAGEMVRDAPMVVAAAGREPRTLLASGRPIVDSEGLRRGAVVAMRDITDQLRLEREAEAATAEMMTRLVRAVSYRDAQTGDHVERISHLCRHLAERAGLPPERCDLIETASLLHDIGKIGIPDTVLLKPGPLDPEEWHLMETHTILGHELLAGSNSAVLQLAATIALSHHERIDGHGYPHGLEGDDIPLAARIATIADAYDALTSDRPYRPAFTVAEALEIISRGRGTHFDAERCDLLTAVPPDGAGVVLARAAGVTPPAR